MDKILSCAMDIGEQMLINGAEVHRVEDSIQRILAAYGTARTDVFTTTSSMVVTIRTTDDDIFTQTRRITDISTDFERLHRLNELSRYICVSKPSPEEITEKLREISLCKKYPLWLEYLCYAIIAGIFTMFFGGGIIEGAIAFAIGAIIRFVIWASDKTVKNKIFAKYISALIATALAYLALRLGVIPTVDNVIIGNIMTLIPGLGLTNALKDLLMGDSIAGMLRTIEACIAALAIAAGYFSVVFLTGGGVV